VGLAFNVGARGHETLNHGQKTSDVWHFCCSPGPASSLTQSHTLSRHPSRSFRHCATASAYQTQTPREWCPKYRSTSDAVFPYATAGSRQHTMELTSTPLEGCTPQRRGWYQRHHVIGVITALNSLTGHAIGTHDAQEHNYSLLLCRN